MSVDRDPYDYSTRVFIKDIAQIFPVFRIFPSCIILKIDLYHAIGVFLKKSISHFIHARCNIYFGFIYFASILSVLEIAIHW